MPEDLTAEAARATVGAGAATFLPLGVNVAGLRCLVVGGGRVGARKALKLATAGADVTVLSPDLAERLAEPVREGAVHWLAEEYSLTRLDGHFLVVACTSDAALNAQIAREADRRGILACVASSGRLSRVIFPAVHSGTGLTVAVHSHGRDCRRSAAVRDCLADLLNDGREIAADKLCLLSVRRDGVPDVVSRDLQVALTSESGQPWCAPEAFWLVTCQRIECYFRAVSPWPVVEDILAGLGDGDGPHEGILRSAAVVRHGMGAYYHLLRVAAGLDSILVGESAVVGQVRAAARVLGDGSSLLRDAVDAVVAAQRHVRRDSGLLASGWADLVVKSLRERLGPLARRGVSLAGCGRLGRSIAQRLLAEGAEVQPISRRAGSAGVNWCRRLGLKAHPPKDLPAMLPGLDALVLMLPLAAGVGEQVARRAREERLLVMDLDGSNAGKGVLSLQDVGSVRLTGVGVARVGSAERLAFEHALRWHGPTAWTGRRLRIGTRGSRLALRQADEAAQSLGILLPQARIETSVLGSPGDRDKATPLPNAQKEDFFTRDLDRALLRGDIDVAVHSAKDLPSRIPAGLRVAALTPSAAPWECLVSRDGEALADLAPGARVGTSSARRREQLLRLRPDLVPCEVRGNVPDRLAQLDTGACEALVLAAAGLIRLGLQDRISEVFALSVFPSAPGQGSLALVVREDAESLLRLLKPLDLGSREGLPWAQE